jgi:hypothetical protein
LRKKSRQSGNENVSPNTWSWQPGCDITPLLGPLSMKDVYVRGAGVKAPPSVLTGDAAWLVDRAGVMRGAAKVRTMAPAATILTLCQGLAVLDIVIVSSTP